MDPSNFLEYGALGILAVVVVMVFKFMFDWMKASSEHNRRLADKAVESLETVVKENTKAQEATQAAMIALTNEMKACDARASKERSEIKQAIERNA